MRLEQTQLATQLAQGLAPVYLISGDEALLVEECCALVRERGRAAGFERQVFIVESGFDWNGVFNALHSPSLFSPRALLELRIPNGKPGETGAQVLVQAAQSPLAQTTLLVSTSKLDKAAQASRWVQALEAAGVFITVWPPSAPQWPTWIRQRLQQRGVDAATGVAELLAYYLEGNLLAAAQEIDKLALLAGSRPLDLATVEASLSDNSRFSVYSLADACLAGRPAPALRMLARLRAEGVEPVLVLWALAREIRSQTQIAERLAAGQSEGEVFAGHKIWPQRRTLVLQACRRLRPAVWRALLAGAARTDKIIKGRLPGDAWHELERLTLALCGVRLIKHPPAAA